jgi:hypothetical protein
MIHRFHPGQSVRFRSEYASRNAASGSYEVKRQLPYGDGEYHYRIKSAREQHERVANESELEQA